MTTMEAYPATKPWYERTSEEGIIDFVAKLSPWIAPLPSAWFVHDAALHHMASGAGLAWVIAIVIETLGLTTTHTALGMHAWNTEHPNQPEKQAPFGLAIILAGTYIVATLMLIVVLEVKPEWNHYAPAMFPILAGVGAVNVTLRFHHAKRVKAEAFQIADTTKRQRELEDEDRDDKREERRIKLAAKYGLTVPSNGVFELSQTVAPVVAFSSDISDSTSNVTKVGTKKSQRQAAIAEYLKNNDDPGASELSRLFKVDRKTIYRDLEKIGKQSR